MSERSGRGGALFDQGARSRIATDLASTLFVEAGAGSGKTTALVGRVVQLLATRRAELAQVAAITFTEAAAAELRLRLYEALTTSTDPDLRAKSSEIDDATITTIHGFAQRLLADHPIEAGLPLHFEVADQIASSLAFEERFAVFLDDLYDDERAQVLMQALTELGVRARRLHDFAEELEGDRLFFELVGEGPTGPLPDVVAIVEQGAADTAARLFELVGVRDDCTDPEDKLLVRLDVLAGELERYRRSPDWASRLNWLGELNAGGAALGSKDSWTDVESVRAAFAEFQDCRQACLDRVAHVLLDDLVPRLRRAAGAAARARVGQGQISFDDLLVLARDLLRDHPRVRRAVKGQFRFILVDEFQDTDPLQCEMLMALADDEGQQGAGRLFFVGDPKQSIYSFRGADVQLYAGTRDEVSLGEPVRLVSNFRSRPGIVSYVNELFSRMFADQIELIGEARAADLVAVREPHSDVAVILLAGPTEGISAGERRALDTDEIARLIAHAVDAGWIVHDADGPRPLRFGDVAILAPSRTGVAQLQAALDRHAIDFTIAETTLIYASDEVREILGILRVVDETGDERDVVRALRSSCFALRDEDLASWRRAGGTWRLDASTPTGLEGHRVASALERMRKLSDSRHGLRLDVLVATLIDELGTRQALAVRRSRAESLRRLDFLVERARAFVAATGGTIGQFLDFADREAAGRARSRELIAYSADVDAVRIMTIHAAKGLEFPFVVVADLAGATSTASSAVLRGSAGAEFSLSLAVRSAGFAEAQKEKSRLDREERTRLAYVAMTRARDYLIIPLRHKAGSKARSSLAEQVWWISTELTSWGSIDLDEAAASAPVAADAAQGSFQTAESSLEPAAEAARDGSFLEEWRARRERVLGSVVRRRHVAPSSLGHETSIEAGDQRARARVAALFDVDEDESSAWHRGRQASAKGRAVHAVLERADLRGAEELLSLAASAADDEGIPEAATEVARLARAALGAPTVRAALESPKMMRELPLRVGIGTGTIEGIVDLCFREQDGLVLVDYKTDALSSAADVALAGARYHLQIGAYALGLEEATGLIVRRAVLIFLAGEDGAMEYEVPDLRVVIDEARREVTKVFAAASELSS